MQFEWRDYLTMWEYEERADNFWMWFAIGFMLSMVVDFSLLARLLLH